MISIPLIGERIERTCCEPAKIDNNVQERLLWGSDFEPILYAPLVRRRCLLCRTASGSYFFFCSSLSTARIRSTVWS